MREITITLGGREFIVPELTVRRTQEWRAKADELLDLFSAVAIPGSDEEYLAQLQGFLNSSQSEVQKLVFEYSSEMQDAREWILDNAYPTEIITAFRNMLGLAYPVDFLARAIVQAMSGSPDSHTSTNYVEQNGASGQTNLTTPQLQN